MPEAWCPFEVFVEYNPPPRTVELPVRNKELFTGITDLKAKLITEPLPATLEEFVTETTDRFEFGPLEPGDPRLKIPRYIVCTALHEVHGYHAMEGNRETARLVGFTTEKIASSTRPFPAFIQETRRCLQQGWRAMRESSFGDKATTLIAWQDALAEIDPSTSETWVPIGEEAMAQGAEASWELGGFVMKNGLMCINYEDTHQQSLNWQEVARDLKYDDRKRSRNQLLAIFRGPLMYRNLPLDEFELTKRSPNARWTEDTKGYMRQELPNMSLFQLVCPAEMALSWDQSQTMLDQLYDSGINVAPACGLFDREVVMAGWKEFEMIRDKLSAEIALLRQENPQLSPQEFAHLAEGHASLRLRQVL